MTNYPFSIHVLYSSMLHLWGTLFTALHVFLIIIKEKIILCYLLHQTFATTSLCTRNLLTVLHYNSLQVTRLLIGWSFYFSPWLCTVNMWNAFTDWFTHKMSMNYFFFACKLVLFLNSVYWISTAVKSPYVKSSWITNRINEQQQLKRGWNSGLKLW